MGIMRCELESSHLINRWGRQIDTEPYGHSGANQCNMGTATNTSQCKIHFFKPTVWCNLLGRPLQTKAALPPHHFRDRIYCCSLGVEPRASEDSVWMTSQLCNKTNAEKHVCVCVCVFVGKRLERWMLMWIEMFCIFLESVLWLWSGLVSVCMRKPHNISVDGMGFKKYSCFSEFSLYLTALWMAVWLAWPLTPLPSKVST